MADTVKVTVNAGHGVRSGGRRYLAGETVELSASDAARLTDLGIVSAPAKPAKAAKAAKSAEE
jgi:hypothetical protein